MESQFRQPKKVINVEVNKQSIARVFDVLYCSVGLRLKSDVLKRGPPSTHTARASPVSRLEEELGEFLGSVLGRVGGSGLASLHLPASYL